MATTELDPNSIKNLQSIEAVVSGPDGANRLLTITGTVPVLVSVSSGSTSLSFSLQLGPTLTRRQFVKANGSTFLCGFGFARGGGNPPTNASWSVIASDADWDDESQRVQLRFDVNVNAGPIDRTEVTLVGFQVTILAEVEVA